MALDVEFYRRTIYLPGAGRGRRLRRISAIDIFPAGATRTLVFVHGYGGNALQWINQLRFFGQKMRVVAPDLRGHGLSDDPASVPYTMDGLVDDLEVVLDALQVQRPFYLAAHSFGGAIATEYALRSGNSDTVQGLVFIAVPARFILRAWLQRVLLVPDPIFTMVAKRLKIALFAPQHTLKRLHDDVMAPWPGDERLPQLRIPTLIVQGQRDIVFHRQHYEDVPRCVPHAHKVIISVSAHLVQLERPDAVNRALRRFIEPTPPQNGQLATPEQRSAAANRMTSHITRLVEMPWLQHYDDEVPEQLPLSPQLLHEMLNNAAREFPDRPAIIFFRQKMRYYELDLLCNRFAHALRQLGVRTGDRVAIVLPNIPQCVIAFYGALRAGAVVVLGSPLSTADEIGYQLRDSGASVLLTLVTYRPLVESISTGTSIQQVIYTDVREYLPLRQRVLLASLIEGSELPVPAAGTMQGANGAGGARTGGVAPERPAVAGRASHKVYSLQQLLREQPATPLESGTTASDLALIQYTGGTTDTPKGVMLSHSNLVVNAAQVRHWLSGARRGREVILGLLPLSHSYGVTGCMNLAVSTAASLVLLPTTRTDQALEAIKAHQPSIFPGVPAFYLAIANYPHVRRYGVSAIRVCVSGSDALPVEVQEAFEKLTRGHLLEGYGLTEASPVTHANPLQGERHVGSIGIPLPGTLARIVDGESGALLPPGEVGELLIQGPQVMLGYWHMPGETAQALQNGWLHTGDLATMDDNGFFTIVDRKKDIILSGSYNVYPRDVEEVLYEHPKVLEAAVVSMLAREQSEAGENGGAPTSPFIKAVVVLKRGEQATADELLALCRERLDAYKVPRQIEFRSELPKNFVGKVLRRLLVEAP
ncbi:MAG: alpha/beta fold hydrolase [Ktedonobacteraceae bacterium]|nr:alpha/beta fold hydrolase [Ktedonobacteraceae bacterium]